MLLLINLNKLQTLHYISVQIQFYTVDDVNGNARTGLFVDTFSLIKNGEGV